VHISLKQVKITDRSFTSSVDTEELNPTVERMKLVSPLLLDIDISNLDGNPLWTVLVDTAKRNPMYAGLAGYIRDQILPNNPHISPKELASRLSISLGEALVILADINRGSE
jgi:hypothetical protein